MVNLSSRLPFNLHNRVLHDSLGRSGSRSNSVDYGQFDNYEHENGSFRNLPSHQHFHPEQEQEDNGFTYNYHHASRSYSPTDRPRSPSAEREVERPAAILKLRLVGVTEAERGRARERTAKPTGLGGGSAAASGSKPSIPVHPADGGESDSITVRPPFLVMLRFKFTPPVKSPTHQFKLKLIDPEDMILSSWNE